MVNPFRLKGPFGSEYGIDADDILRTKKALSSLGHLPGPKGPITPYADRWMIDGLKSFQRSNGLAVDGIMKPGGPTAKALGQALGDIDEPPRFVADPRRENLPPYVISELPQERPRWPRPLDFPRPSPSVFGTLFEVGHGRRNLPRDVLAARRALAWSGDLPAERVATPATARSGDHADLFDAIERFQKRNGLNIDGWMGPNGETARTLDTAIAEKVKAHGEAGNRQDIANDKAKDGGTQVGMAGPAINLLLRQLPRLLPGIVGGIAGQRAIEETLTPKGAPANPRPDIATPPPTPPLELDDNRFPNKEEYPAEAPEIPKVPASENPEVINNIVQGFPNGTDHIEKMLILESRGDERTQRLNNHCLDKMISEAKSREMVESAVHVSGAVSDPDGWKKENLRREQEGVRGVRSDAQIRLKMKDGTVRHDDLQTVDTYADKISPDRREADAMDRLRKHKGAAKEIGDILAVPKRRDLSEDEAKAICDRMVEEFADKHWGPRKIKSGG
jgi:hypothetical protein